MPTTQTEEYFGKPTSHQKNVDTAALIVAIVNGRQSATRTDYAHPRLMEIVRLLEQAPLH